MLTDATEKKKLTAMERCLAEIEAMNAHYARELSTQIHGKPLKLKPYVMAGDETVFAFDCKNLGE